MVTEFSRWKPQESEASQPEEKFTRDTAMQLIREKKLPRNTDLRGIDFSGADFSGVRFENAYFPEANLSGANFNGAEFHGNSVEFQKVNFCGASFVGARFCTQGDARHANLLGADFTGVTFEGGSVSFENALIDNTTVPPPGFPLERLINVDEGKDFSKKNILGAYFDFIDLGGANFREAILIGAKFGHVKSVKNADFFGAQIALVDFRDVDISGCDFMETRGFDEAQFDGARYNSATQFPEGCVPEDHGMVRV